MKKTGNVEDSEAGKKRCGQRKKERKKDGLMKKSGRCRR